MDLFELTRKLIDIESITLNEREAGEFLFAHLSEMAVRHQGRVEIYQRMVRQILNTQ